MAAATCCAVPPNNNRSKFMSTTRCEGYVGSRIASRYDEDEEDDEGGGVDDDVAALPDGTILEEDEEQEEEEDEKRVNHVAHYSTRTQQQMHCLREAVGGVSVSQSRTRANRYRRAFGARW